MLAVARRMLIVAAAAGLAVGGAEARAAEAGPLPSQQALDYIALVPRA